MLFYECEFCQSPLYHNDSVKDLGIFLDFKSRFHNYVDSIVSQCVKLLDIAVSVTTSCFFLKLLHTRALTCIYLYIQYFTLSRSKLEYTCVVWNSITAIDASKLEHIQQKIAALCFNKFFPPCTFYLHLCFKDIKIAHLVQERVSPQCTVCLSSHLFSKFCPLLETVGP